MKQFHDAKLFDSRLPSFVIPKITVDWHMKPEIKDAVNMEDLICLLGTVRTLNEIYSLQQNKKSLGIVPQNDSFQSLLFYIFTSSRLSGTFVKIFEFGSFFTHPIVASELDGAFNVYHS